jgi:hypothetical protein
MWADISHLTREEALNLMNPRSSPSFLSRPFKK